MKKFLLIFGILIVFIVQVVLSYFIMDMLFPSDDPSLAQDSTEESQGGEEHGDKKDGKSKDGKEEGTPEGFGATYAMQDLILNPMGATGKRIFKISLALEYDAENEVLPEELKTREPFIRDFLLEYLGKVPEDSLGDIRNRGALRDSLQVHINSFLEGGSVSRVLFLDFIRQ
jgi:flagellar basal body-associated protein FliL